MFFDRNEIHIQVGVHFSILIFVKLFSKYVLKKSQENPKTNRKTESKKPGTWDIQISRIFEIFEFSKAER